MSPKQKIVHGRGLSNLNLGIFVFSFDVCRSSKPVPSINYDGKDAKSQCVHCFSVFKTETKFIFNNNYQKLIARVKVLFIIIF